MKRELSIYYTSDIHGFFSDVDYPTGQIHASGLCRCSSLFRHDGNTLIIDGGDTIQGSPFTYWYHKQNRGSAYLPAEVMNAAGYQFVTLGNHDFSYGVSVAEEYVQQLNAVCLCANIEGIRGIQKTALVTMENGLRVGLTGITSHYISRWEPPENLQGITIRDAFTAAKESLQELKDAGADVTVCIYHGGFENDIGTGKSLAPSDENQGWRICKELDYDILLSGHQHQMIESACIAGTYTCQPPDKAGGFIRMAVEHRSGRDGENNTSVHSCFVPARETRDEKLWKILSEKEEQASEWLDTAAGTLDAALKADKHVVMAANGSLIANFFNQVQLEASGAQVSATCLGNQVRGFSENIRYRDVLANYLFPNTLKTILVDRRVLKQALERCAEYFTRLPDGELAVSETFLQPIEQHFNYDYFSGIEVHMDIRKPVGERVISIRFEGKELDENRNLTLCLNNYRASGAGGYPVYGSCRTVREQSEEISELIMDYVERHKTIKTDQTKWLTVIS